MSKSMDTFYIELVLALSVYFFPRIELGDIKL